MADINDFPLYMGNGRINASVGFDLKRTGALGTAWKRLEGKINYAQRVKNQEAAKNFGMTNRQTFQ